MTDVSAFVLTIDKAGGLRRLHAEREMIAVGLPFFMVEGIKVADLKARTAYSPALNLLLQKRSLAPPEIAIYEGHRRIWQEIVARKLDMALVVEDDVRFTDRAAFAEVLEHLDHIRDKWDVVKFFDYKPKKPIETYAFRNLKLVTYKYPASGAVAYLINARAAEALLRRKRIFRPVDEDFSHPWEFSLRIWSTQPNLAEEVSAELGGSLTETERYAQRRRKNILRSIWGNVLQGSKLVRSHIYRWKLRKMIGASK
jgi:GR25 family glycosyltransferase involved in LPS biosynthesis